MDLVNKAIVLSGHILQLIGIFIAFLATGIAFVYANLIKGGIAGKASFYNAIGFTVLAVNIFLIYAAAITGKLNLLDVTFF